MSVAIKIDNLSFHYLKGEPIFNQFTWQVQPGELWSVIGPSGCGKTTLLYLLAGLRRPDAGQIRINDEPLIKPRNKTGLVIQEYGLLPWATAHDNVSLGLKIQGLRNGTYQQRTSHWLTRLGLMDREGHYPAQLSGGQKQRVAIARALALEPDLLLMDEPFASVDAMTRERLQELVLSLENENRITSIIITHQVEEAVLMGEKILVLSPACNSEAMIIENTGGGSPDYRDTQPFVSKVRELRGIVAGWNQTAGVG